MGRQITIRFTGQLRTLAGCSSLDLDVAEGVTLAEALFVLRERMPAAFGERVLEPLLAGRATGVLVLRNRALCSERDLERPLGQGDVIAFVTPMEGG